MRTRIVVPFCALALTAGAAIFAPRAAEPAAPVDFNRDVRPILSDHCFACHGPDENQRKAKLRLDTRAGAFAALRGGGHALVAGKPGESAVIERITAADESKRMPPAKFGKPLKPEQVAKLKAWVEQGAKWSEHWAFTAPVRPPVPPIRNPRSEIRNSIDAFVLARLEKEKLAPSPEADKARLIRRVTLDLTGLTPTLKEIDDFLADRSSDAYEKVVDRLLRSPRCGEHMARYWLDAARYGDTHGLHLDNYREIWPFRDWVIRAFNANMPFDRFVIEQLAGDLLPNPTTDQLVATGFNRCHVTTSEGGSIEEEIYVRNVVDQVDTNGTVFLGLSVGCARCHDHKYDPVSMRDYYGMFAFFNNLDGPALDGNAPLPPPATKVGTPEQLAALAAVQKRYDEVRQRIDAEVARLRNEKEIDATDEAPAKREDFVWIDDALPPGAQPQADGNVNLSWTFVAKPQPVERGAKSVRLEGSGLRQVVLMNAQPPLTVGRGDRLFAHVYLDPKNPPKEVMLQWHTAGWSHRAYWGENRIEWGADKSPERLHVGPLPKAGEWVRLEVEASRVGINPGAAINGWAFTQFDGLSHWDRAGLNTQTPQGPQQVNSFAAWERAQRATGGASLPRPIQAIAKLTPDKRNDAQRQQLRDYFIEHAYAKARPVFDPLRQQLDVIQKEKDAIDKQMPSSLIFKERADVRPAYILKRGEYDQRGEKVERRLPAFLPPLPKDAPLNRLGFARWLVSPDHPLTARVAVNRFWQQFFGSGLVKTAEDFGSQGEPPSHPELLDWLAVQFRESGWDVKAIVKLMVMSATYRRSSKVTPEQLAKDRENRLLSRGPRFRLDAEVLRDQALAASGLLVEMVGGPGVRPPQPAGIWEAVGYVSSNTRNFKADQGPDKVHRRSLYTFLKRTAPPPQMGALDAPSREACRVRRERTNTPLQAMLLMNEAQYVEAARALAERTLREAGPSPTERVRLMFRLVAARSPDERESADLLAALADFRAAYTKDPAAARKLIAIGETKPDAKLDPTELAAWTMVGNIVLNLDEVLNKG